MQKLRQLKHFLDTEIDYTQEGIFFPLAKILERFVEEVWNAQVQTSFNTNKAKC